MGRWISRDPSEEGFTPYLFIDNAVSNAFDYLGLWKKDWDEFVKDPRSKGLFESGDNNAIMAGYKDWMDKKYHQNDILDIYKVIDFSNMPPPSNASFSGFEALYGLKGRGSIEVKCCDKEKTLHTFYYKKECYGVGVGFGYTVGEIKGMETCDKRDYEGWFGEIGGSVGIFSAGIDLSFKNSTIDLPLINHPAPNIRKLGKVREAGVGVGVGPGEVGGKIMFCYYTLEPIVIEPKKCGCDNVPHAE